jgi:threonine synthase
MRCRSTRGGDEVSLSEAISRGLAADGGLFMPAALPEVTLAAGPIPAVAEALLAPLFEGDALAGQLRAICEGAFTFPAPTRWLAPDTGLLELFHGPTAAFKDFGARFLAQALARLAPAPLTTVLVATSGDTGAAVAGAFHGLPGFRVVVLYPDGRVSARQAHQLGAFGGNVTTYRVAGTFDDCQRMVKEAFLDRALQGRHALTSANSISLGRLLPQMAYYAAASLEARAAGRPPVSFVIPTGNLGNAVACLMARRMGLPIGQVVLATNANRVLPDFLRTGQYRPRASVATLANAMDVGAPSNLERLEALFPEPNQAVTVDWVDDATLQARIRETWVRHQVAVCPHTACGLEVLARLRTAGASGDFLVAATAHPAKFDTVVEPLVGQVVPAPPDLAALLARPSSARPLAASLQALIAALD